MDHELTRLLQRCAAGDAGARDALFESLYPALRRLAHARLRDERQASLQTTALVHETYLRVVGHATRAEDRAQFMAYAARIMRTVITDAARERLSQRRGAGAPHLPLDTERQDRLADGGAGDILRVHEAVLALEAVDARAARVVEMRYFAGYEESEIAGLLGVTERTVQRDWSKARAILAEALRD